MSRLDTYARCRREIVYGPVPSRRLGKSIGINLFPGERKVCSFNCVYCFIKEENHNSEIKYAQKDDLINELNAFFSSPENYEQIEEARYITFSGNGEPTLHPEFNDIVKTVFAWKQDHKHKFKLAIFTNSSQLGNPKVKEALLLFDKIFCKFDWSSDEELNAISHPQDPSLSFDKIVKNLKDLVNYVRSNNRENDVILQTAIYTKDRTIKNWTLWAQ
jgi:wyosine [tRNA(Phe)-imidazoG37] synthetase (radical SAM superfamily)